MNGTNYDDWNFDSTVSTDYSKSPSAEINTNIFPVLLLFCSAAFVVINIVNAYSVGYAVTLNSGRQGFICLVHQVVYVLAGFAVFLLICKVNLKVLKVVSPFLVILCCLASMMDAVLPLGLMKSSWFIMLVFFSGILYNSAYFGKKTNIISGVEEISIPCALTVVFVVVILSTGNYTYFFSYIAITLIMFHIGGVGFGGIILLIMMCAVPSVIYLITSPSRLYPILEFLVPSYEQAGAITSATLSKAALVSGSLLGKGVGAGHYKYILSADSSVIYFCNYAEETGLIGVLFLFALFMLYFICGLYASNHSCSKDCFIADMCCGSAIVVFCRFLMNIACVIGLVPFVGVSCPFVTSGPDIIVILGCTAFMYRALCLNDDRPKEDTELSVRMASGDELIGN